MRLQAVLTREDVHTGVSLSCHCSPGPWTRRVEVSGGRLAGRRVGPQGRCTPSAALGPPPWAPWPGQRAGDLSLAVLVSQAAGRNHQGL